MNFGATLRSSQARSNPRSAILQLGALFGVAACHNDTQLMVQPPLNAAPVSAATTISPGRPSAVAAPVSLIFTGNLLEHALTQGNFGARRLDQLLERAIGWIERTDPVRTISTYLLSELFTSRVIALALDRDLTR